MPRTGVAAAPDRVAAVLRDAAMPVLIIESRTQHIVAASPSVAQLAGVRPEELIGKTAVGFLANEPSGVLQLLLQGAILSYEVRGRLRRTGIDVRIWLRLLTADSDRHALAILMPERTGNSAGTALLGSETVGQMDLLRASIERFTDEVLAAIGRPVAPGVNRDLLARLGERERDIALELLRGNRVSAIAGRLYLSPGTVRNHLSSVYRKLGVANQQELIDLMRRTSR